MKKYGPILIAVLILASVATAGAIHTWANGDTLTATDLNANFQHIHSTMVGGHGPRLVNADVASNAAIVKSKIWHGEDVPKGWATLPSARAIACGAHAPTTCTGMVTGGFTSVGIVATAATVGSFTVTFSPARPNASYMVFMASDTNPAQCVPVNLATGGFDITCADFTGAAINSAYSFMLFDDDFATGD